MLWMFLAVGCIGVLSGCLYRAPALIFLSALSFVSIVLISLVFRVAAADAALLAFFVAGSLQLGYLLGVALRLALDMLADRFQRRFSIALSTQHAINGSRPKPFQNNWARSGEV
jgi:hypothetical protein